MGGASDAPRTKHLTVVATPEYLAARPAIHSPSDLLGHECLVWHFRAYGEWLRWEFLLDRQTLHVEVKPVFMASDMGVVIAAALTGSGLAYVLREQVAAHVASGRLVEVLLEFLVPHDAC